MLPVRCGHISGSRPNPPAAGPAPARSRACRTVTSRRRVAASVARQPLPVGAEQRGDLERRLRRSPDERHATRGCTGSRAEQRDARCAHHRRQGRTRDPVRHPWCEASVQRISLGTTHLAYAIGHRIMELDLATGNLRRLYTAQLAPNARDHQQWTCALGRGRPPDPLHPGLTAGPRGSASSRGRRRRPQPPGNQPSTVGTRDGTRTRPSSHRCRWCRRRQPAVR